MQWLWAKNLYKRIKQESSSIFSRTIWYSTIQIFVFFKVYHNETDCYIPNLGKCNPYDCFAKSTFPFYVNTLTFLVNFQRYSASATYLLRNFRETRVFLSPAIMQMTCPLSRHRTTETWMENRKRTAAKPSFTLPKKKKKLLIDAQGLRR